MQQDTKKGTQTPTPETANHFLEHSAVIPLLHRCLAISSTLRLALYSFANAEGNPTDIFQLWEVSKLLEEQLNTFSDDLETATSGLLIATA